MSFCATSPSPSGTRAGLTGELAETTPCSRSHSQKMLSFESSGESEVGDWTEVAEREMSLLLGVVLGGFLGK